MTRIGFFGNCQTLALSWFFRKIHPTWENKWIRAPRFGGDVEWPERMLGRGNETPSEHIIEIDGVTEIDYIKSCDMFVHTFEASPASSVNLFNTEIVEALLPEQCLTVMMPTVIVRHDSNAVGEFIMKHEAKVRDKFNVSFKNLIYDDKAQMRDELHPNSYLFLEMVNRVCSELGVDGIPEDEYQPFLDYGWPFDRNKKRGKKRSILEKNDMMRDDIQ